MTESEVMALATAENPIICKAGNKIEFKNGTCYAIRVPEMKYYKVKVFTL